MEAALTLQVGSKTDVGRRRSDNQDALLVQTLPNGGLLAAIADGMGGLANGALASTAAIAALQEATSSAPSIESVVQGFELGHQRIRELTSDEPMGTTLVATLIVDGEAQIFNIGDCRAYLIDAVSMIQVTKDHSLVASQVEAGLISEDEARNSPMRNVLTRALGPDEAAPQVDQFGPIGLGSGAAIVLCSDGLHTLVTDVEIAETVRGRYPQAAAEELVRLANERGGFDNITVIVVVNT